MTVPVKLLRLEGKDAAEARLVERGRAISTGIMHCVGSSAGTGGLTGVRICCWRSELAVINTSTSLDNGPVISTACATADCVATDTSFTVTCVAADGGGGKPADI